MPLLVFQHYLSPHRIDSRTRLRWRLLRHRRQEEHDGSKAAGYMKLFPSLLLILPAPLTYAQIFQNQPRNRIKKSRLIIYKAAKKLKAKIIS